ncbi:MAG: SAM-dependent methyltransferase [Clostridia bacterium]|nr:SAM-dependent methyltransferase [Clostridia bacterium]
MLPVVIDKRMTCIAKCVRQDAILADIGTDHGKLPIYLAQTGKISKAVAADINEMPLQKAKNNVKKYGLDGQIDTYLTDGLKGIERFSPTDVVIAGMGGELIEQILQEQTINKTGVKYILQPMTKEESVRMFLCENGYTVTDEYIVEEGKIYQIICAEYTGEFTAMTPAEYLLGRINIEKNERLLEKLADKVISRQKVKIAGRQKAGLSVEEDVRCLDELLVIKENCYGKR